MLHTGINDQDCKLQPYFILNYILWYRCNISDKNLRIETNHWN